MTTTKEQADSAYNVAVWERLAQVTSVNKRKAPAPTGYLSKLGRKDPIRVQLERDVAQLRSERLEEAKQTPEQVIADCQRTSDRLWEHYLLLGNNDKEDTRLDSALHTLHDFELQAEPVYPTRVAPLALERGSVITPALTAGVL